MQKVYKEQHEIGNGASDWEVVDTSFVPSTKVMEILEQFEIDLLQEIEETTNKDIYKIE